MATHTVKFNKPVIFTDHTGVSFVKNPVPETLGAEISNDPYFDNAGIWTIPLASTIIDGVATLDVAGVEHFSNQTLTGFAANDVFEIRIEMDARASGEGVVIFLADTGLESLTVPVESTGTYRMRIPSDYVGNLPGNRLNIRKGNGLTDPVVYSLSVKHVGPASFEEELTGPFTTDETSPSDTLSYNNVVWTDPVIAGDVIEFRYNSGTGNYTFEDGETFESELSPDVGFDIPLDTTAWLTNAGTPSIAGSELTLNGFDTIQGASLGDLTTFSSGDVIEMAITMNDSVPLEGVTVALAQLAVFDSIESSGVYRGTLADVPLGNNMFVRELNGTAQPLVIQSISLRRVVAQISPAEDMVFTLTNCEDATIQSSGQQGISARSGGVDKTSVAIVVKSLVAGDAIVSIDNRKIPVTMTAIGTDNIANQPQAGFHGTAVVTGLTAGTKYPYYVNQGSSNIQCSTWTAPADRNRDFILIPITCDNMLSTGGFPTGGYTHIKEIAQANPTKPIYLYHVDDVMGYNDTAPCDELGTGMGHALTAVNSATDPLVYNYAICVLALEGLMSETGDAGCQFGHDFDRQWVFKNIPVLPSFGDHDLGDNEMGWGLDPSFAGAAQYNAALPVWNAFYAPLSGKTAQDTNLSARHWFADLGCVRLIAMDGVTEGSGDGGNGINPGEVVQPSQVYEPSQIADVLTVANSNQPFTLLGMMYGVRYAEANPSKFNSGCQNALWGMANYSQLVTDNGGLMDLAATNGTTGQVIFVHGDYHAAHAVHHQNVSGVHPEDFYSICVATVNGSVNFNGTQYEGVTFDGSTWEYSEGVYQGHQWWVCPFYVNGSHATKNIVVEMYNDQKQLRYTRTFTAP